MDTQFNTLNDLNGGEMAPEPRKRRDRPRKKHLRKMLLAQMEFYFGDSNLHQDRFLKQQIQASADGFVDLEMFMKFNKISKIGATVDDLKGALTRSTKLELNEDRSKVRRIAPLLPPVNLDERTVYVEGLPRTADHEWLKNALSDYDSVNYVSLPKYRSTGELKGFAFVEFSTEEGARKCLAALGTKEFNSIKPFPKLGSKDVQRMQRAAERVGADANIDHSGKLPVEDDVESKGDRCEVQLKDDIAMSEPVQNVEGHMSAHIATDSVIKEQPIRKRKHKSIIADEKQPTVKKVKEDSGVVELNTPQSKSTVPSNGHESLDKSVEDSDPSAQSGDPKPTQCKENKKKSHKKNRKAQEKRKEQNEVKALHLKVISKCEWLQLRSQYLSTQKSNMAALKRLLKTKADEQRKAESGTTGKTEVMNLVPNVIVQFSSDKSTTRQHIKGWIPAGVKVAYIDIKAGNDTSGFIRCETSDDAKTLLKNGASDQLTLSLVQGEEERLYWDQLNQQRSEKRDKSKTKTKPKKKGSQKILEKADVMRVGTRVVFDED